MAIAFIRLCHNLKVFYVSSLHSPNFHHKLIPISSSSTSQMGFLWVVVFSSVLAFTVAQEKQVYIVRINNEMKPSLFYDVEHWYHSIVSSLTSSNTQGKNITPQSSLLHVYRTVFHGFGARLTGDEARKLKARPEVLAIFPSQIRQVQTTRSPQFLGLVDKINNIGSLLNESDFGSNVIIGVLDSGIWPERKSFNDNGLGPIPLHWKGECVEGTNFSKSLCNKKLIGARFFNTLFGADPSSYPSAKDYEGHGTHTASTAAGRIVESANFLGYANGIASGIAPKSRIAVYKICWARGCAEADIVAAFDKAVEDGVNVISFSVGSDPKIKYLDPVSIATFGAMNHGVFVSAAGGNDGPGKSTVSNIAPWITTVGAGTIDRKFPADLILADGTVIIGTSLYNGAPLPKEPTLPLVYAKDISKSGNGNLASLCLENSLDPELAHGKIVICERGSIARVAKGEFVKRAGGVGMVLANTSPEGESLISDAHVLPALLITKSAGDNVHRYLNTSKDPRATIVFHGTKVDVKPAPVVAGFSSRGPSFASKYVIKPDLIAPGVDILATWPENLSPTELPSDTRRTEFNIMSGTSMACPHVSGIAALLKGAHSNWSPAMIRSAMMTTAYVRDNEGNPLLDEGNNNVSTVWDYGSGHVNPEKALNPGLVFNLTNNDYIDFLCASNYSEGDINSITRKEVHCPENGTKPWDLNYPSISVSFEQSDATKYEVIVTRTAINVNDGTSTYTPKIENPSGTTVSVDPSKLLFKKKDEKLSFQVNISAENVKIAPEKTKSVFGRITWEDGTHFVGMPIVVTWQPKFQ